MTDTLGGIGSRPGWRLQDLGRQPTYDPSNGREMRAWNPSWRDRLGYLAGAGLEALGAGRSGQQRAIEGVRTVADFVPLLGETLGVDDTARALEGGRYGEAALSGAATLAGMVPIAGDLAGAALKKAGREAVEVTGRAVAKEAATDWASLPYHRFTRGDSPMNDADWMMFSKGSPARVEGYGDRHWVTGEHLYGQGEIISATDDAFTDALASALRRHDENGTLPSGYYGDQIDELVELAAPRNIVDSAGIWDSELVPIIYNDVVFPNNWKGVVTPDGFISFDAKGVKRFTGDWADHWK